MHADKGCRRRVAGESGERTEGEGGIEKRCKAEGGAEVPREDDLRSVAIDQRIKSATQDTSGLV